MQQEMAFRSPTAALFFNYRPDRLIVACYTGIFIVDVNTQSTQSFSGTPQGASYFPYALALSADDNTLVAGNWSSPRSVCGYNTASMSRLWIYNTVHQVGAVCLLGAHVLATVRCNPTLVLDRITGAHIAELQKADGWVLGLGVIEGRDCFFISSN
jgi:hypothetical protein